MDDISWTLYLERWWLLGTYVILVFINKGHLMAFASVTKHAAVYYDQPGDRIDLILVVSYVIGIPFCLVCPYTVAVKGLKFSILLGGILTCIGRIIVY